MFGTAIFLSSILNLLLPVITQLDQTSVMIVRFVQGLADGVTIPAVFGMFRWWAPPLERTSMVLLSLSGSYIGASFGVQLSDHITDTFGWNSPCIFYSCFGLTWFLLWIFLSFETPLKHPAISTKEQLFIEKSLQYLPKEAPIFSQTPWLKVK